MSLNESASGWQVDARKAGESAPLVLATSGAVETIVWLKGSCQTNP